MVNDEKEIKESLNIIAENPDDAVIMNLIAGDYVIMNKELFDRILTNLPSGEGLFDVEINKEEL